MERGSINNRVLALSTLHKDKPLFPKKSANWWAYSQVIALMTPARRKNRAGGFGGSRRVRF
jgi:hypothetical protein